MDIDKLQKASDLGLTYRLTVRNYFNAIAQAAADAATHMERGAKNDQSHEAGLEFRQAEKDARAMAARFNR